MKETIAFFEATPDNEKYIKKVLKGHNLKFFKETIQEVDSKKYKDSTIISVFIYSKVSSDIMKKIPKLKCVATRSTGFDHVDLAYCKKNKIPVGNVPFYGENTVAEHTFALILNLSRKVHESHIRTKQKNYSIEGLEGFDLKGKTLGVIGVGHIGMHVIRIAKGFGMHVKAFDLNRDIFTSEILHFEYADMEEILKSSDIISLHVPYNKHTHHLIDKEKISKMKKGAMIINTARGGIIDTKELYNALKSKKLGGAGLDVIEAEELIAHEDELMENEGAREKLYQVFMDEEIFGMENVIFTPHNAFNSKEAKLRIIDTTLDNLKEYIKTNNVKYPVQ